MASRFVPCLRRVLMPSSAIVRNARIPVASASLRTEGKQIAPLCSRAQSDARILLPWNLHSEVGFDVPTEIKDSTIPNGGLGRFIKEFVTAGSVIRADPIISVQDFISSGGVSPSQTVAIEMLDAGDMDALVEHFAASRESSLEHIRTMISWFVAGVPAERTDRGRPLVYLLAHSFHSNHSDAEHANIETVVENGLLLQKTVRDISPDSEILLDYTTMGIEDFAKTWCAENRVSDVESMSTKDVFDTTNSSRVSANHM
eukprot:TRINITY_DN2221_c0_g1_i2.p1 TRINITY_DN2221_c0_g1~~TRINITY_DN2221_c0_g1_i2.p1  ORF type:complete len:258 (-),score=37.02 TRINITY_DN2221_c0_g1_i2:54-827(-)